MEIIIDKALAAEFERPAHGRPYDETDISLRAYVTRIPAAKLDAYDPGFTDEELMAWDGGFREDGDLMLVCCERDVDAVEFRAVVEEFLEYRRTRA
jgi:hypothetical protein